jgi:hypothetical protein
MQKLGLGYTLVWAVAGDKQAVEIRTSEVVGISRQGITVSRHSDGLIDTFTLSEAEEMVCEED